MTRDPNAAAKARAAEQEAAGLKTLDISAAAPKKKPVFKSTLQPHNAGVVAPAPAVVVEDEDPSGMVRNGWVDDAYRPMLITPCEDGGCTVCGGRGVEVGGARA